MTTVLRPSRHDVLMDSAWLWSQRSTCSRLQVGAVFARDGRILVTGYNGAPAGLPHCDHACDCLDKPCHESCNSNQPCVTAEHAERNAIAFAARHGVQLEGSALYVTHMPCRPCAMSVINAGVVSVAYKKGYRDRSGIKLLTQAGVKVTMYSLPQYSS